MLGDYCLGLLGSWVTDGQGGEEGMLEEISQ